MDIAPNSSTFSYIIDRFTYDGNLEAALQYIYSMKARKLVPELHIVEAIVILAADIGYARLAIDLATWFEDISIRRLDQAVWVSCLRSSANSLYVSLRCETVFLFLSDDFVFKRWMAYFTVGKLLSKALTSPQMKAFAYQFSIRPLAMVFRTWLRMSFEFLNS
jgi:pentatricopeptide repeat protein